MKVELKSRDLSLNDVLGIIKLLNNEHKTDIFVKALKSERVVIGD